MGEPDLPPRAWGQWAATLLSIVPRHNQVITVENLSCSPLLRSLRRDRNASVGAVATHYAEGFCGGSDGLLWV